MHYYYYAEDIGASRCSYALRRYVSGLLFQVQPWDPAMYGRAALTLGMVALLTCWIPARRAARVDPVVILRRE